MGNLRKLKVLESIDNGLHHISCSRNDRLPTWDELKYVREKYADPHKFYVMVLPPKEFYVNLHKFCFHIWEVKSELEVNTWKGM